MHSCVNQHVHGRTQAELGAVPEACGLHAGGLVGIGCSSSVSVLPAPPVGRPPGSRTERKRHWETNKSTVVHLQNYCMSEMLVLDRIHSRQILGRYPFFVNYFSIEGYIITGHWRIHASWTLIWTLQEKNRRSEKNPNFHLFRISRCTVAIPEFQQN